MATKYIVVFNKNNQVGTYSTFLFKIKKSFRYREWKLVYHHSGSRIGYNIGYNYIHYCNFVSSV